jgi:hypothetical protein
MDSFHKSYVNVFMDNVRKLREPFCMFSFMTVMTYYNLHISGREIDIRVMVVICSQNVLV